jgi:hypothetical protein
MAIFSRLFLHLLYLLLIVITSDLELVDGAGGELPGLANQLPVRQGSMVTASGRLVGAVSEDVATQWVVYAPRTGVSRRTGRTLTASPRRAETPWLGSFFAHEYLVCGFFMLRHK